VISGRSLRMANITAQAMIAAGVLSFFLAVIWEILIGNPLLGFWLDWVAWFACILCVCVREVVRGVFTDDPFWDTLSGVAPFIAGCVPARPAGATGERSQSSARVSKARQQMATGMPVVYMFEPSAVWAVSIGLVTRVRSN